MEIIKEELLDERSLQTLTSAAVLKLGDIIYKDLVEREGDMDLGTYAILPLKDLHNSKYMDKVNSGRSPFNDSVSQFLVYTNIKIFLIRGKANHGTYKTFAGDKYSVSDRKEIDIEVNPEEFQERIGNSYKSGYIKNGRDVYVKLYFLIYSTLLHELRHAYDDFRTRGKVFQSKESNKFFHDQISGKHKAWREYLGKKAEEIADETLKKELNDISLQYIRLPHEVWARYTQALEHVSFVSMEFDDDFKLPETMNPIHDVMRDFKRHMVNFNVLPEKVKRRLFKAVSNAWHDAKDYLDKYGTYSNPHNKKLHEMNSKIDAQELEDEIEMRLLPRENFLSYNDIIQISDIFGLDEEEVAQAVSMFVMKREEEKYRETKEDVQAYVKELQDNGVRTDIESVGNMTQAFIDAHGNYHIEELGIELDVLKGIVGLATKDPEQLKLFESVRRQIQKTIFRSLMGTL